MRQHASRSTFLALAILSLLGCGAPSRDLAGRWHAWLESPGGPLPFALDIERGPDGLAAFVVNGAERAAVPRVQVDGDTVTLDFEHFDSTIVARLDPTGGRMDGDWTRTAGPDGERSHLVFHAEAGDRPRFPADGPAGDPGALNGRWAVDFESDDNLSVGEFQADGDGTVHGTFLNTAGDYRYLAGDFREGRLRLSTFDGAHAFLFVAALGADGSLNGDFWSRDTWHESWSARHDPEAELPDPFGLTSANGDVALGELSYPDLDGTPRRLDDARYDGTARLIVVFGTWCPNCNDATDFLVELDERYRDRGLSILGLAFEMTGDFDRDAAQVRTYVQYHGIQYPILVAGLSDKDAASESFPLIDRVRSFPTVLFVGGDGEIRAVHQGFTGPATGAAYPALRERFEVLIEDMLSGSTARAQRRIRKLVG